MAARRNLFAAIICFLLGGVVILVLGTWLVNTFGTTPDLPTAALHVIDKLLGEAGLVQAPMRSGLLCGSRSCWTFMGAAVILTSTYLLFRPPPETHTLSAVDEARVRTLLRTSAIGTRSATSPPGGTSPSCGTPATPRLRKRAFPTG